MAYNLDKALPKHWAQNWKTLEFILKCAGYQMHGNGIECGWYKKDHGYWFCDDGDVEYTSEIKSWQI